MNAHAQNAKTAKLANVIPMPLLVQHQVTGVIHTRNCSRLRRVPADRLRHIHDVDRLFHLCRCVYERFGAGLSDCELRERLYADPFSLVTRRQA